MSDRIWQRPAELQPGPVAHDRVSRGKRSRGGVADRDYPPHHLDAALQSRPRV